MTDSPEPVVLVVEDEPDVAETYQLWLSRSYEVRVANDGEEGLSELDDEVDVVLLDRRMPGLSGDEVLDRIRDRDLQCGVAMVTAVDPDFDILEMGFDDYLKKPVRGEELQDTVDRLIDRAEYDELLQEYYALVEKQATIETAKSDAELAANDDYQQLKEQIADLQEDLSETIGGVDDDSAFLSAVQRIGGDDS